MISLLVCFSTENNRWLGTSSAAAYCICCCECDDDAAVAAAAAAAARADRCGRLGIANRATKLVRSSKASSASRRVDTGKPATCVSVQFNNLSQQQRDAGDPATTPLTTRLGPSDRPTAAVASFLFILISKHLSSAAGGTGTGGGACAAAATATVGACGCASGCIDDVSSPSAAAPPPPPSRRTRRLGSIPARLPRRVRKPQVAPDALTAAGCPEAEADKCPEAAAAAAAVAAASAATGWPCEST